MKKSKLFILAMVCLGAFVILAPFAGNPTYFVIAMACLLLCVILIIASKHAL
jgi:predicted signal transduction protein with EAL and GGDEF domain